MLQIWLLYDLYFLVCAFIVAKPYVGMYSLATIVVQWVHEYTCVCY